MCCKCLQIFLFTSGKPKFNFILMLFVILRCNFLGAFAELRLDAAEKAVWILQSCRERDAMFLPHNNDTLHALVDLIAKQSYRKARIHTHRRCRRVWPPRLWCKILHWNQGVEILFFFLSSITIKNKNYKALYWVHSNKNTNTKFIGLQTWYFLRNMKS